MSVRLSLAMITKDDARTIGRALDSAASFCDEIVVVDLGSRDKSRQIAEERGARVHEMEWTEDFGAARDRSFDECTGDWILWLGASDVIKPDVRARFELFKEALDDQLSTVDVVVAPYVWSLAADGSPLVTFHRERLVRRAAGLRWQGRVHERLPIPMDNFALTSDLVVEHHPDADRQTPAADEALALLEKMAAGGDESPRTMFHLANELYDHGRFGEAAARYRSYLQGDPDGADRYWAGLYLAESMLVMEEPDEARRVLLATIGEDSSRAEAYVALGRISYEAEDWAEAIPLFTAATAGLRPRIGLWRDADYTYGPWDYLAVCYDKINDASSALTCAQRAIPGNPQADRVRSNMRWMVDRL